MGARKHYWHLTGSASYIEHYTMFMTVPNHQEVSPTPISPIAKAQNAFG